MYDEETSLHEALRLAAGRSSEIKSSVLEAQTRHWPLAARGLMRCSKAPMAM